MRVAVILCLAAVGACQGSESVEIPPPVDAPFTAMTGGLLPTCAVTTSNHVYCWGWNRDGEIGGASKTDRPYPTQIANTTKFTGAAAGGGAPGCGPRGGEGACLGCNLARGDQS